MSLVSVSIVTWLGFAVASAASLPVTSDALFAQITDDRPTGTIVSDDFPSNGQLSGSVPVVAPAGSSWLVATGQVTTQSGQAETKGNGPSRATIDLTVSDGYTASTDVSALGSATSAGVSFLGNGGTYMYAVYDSATGLAHIYASASGTPIASSSSLGTLASFTMSIQVDQPTITVRVNGAVVITHTLTASETGTEAGFLADANGATFENFVVVSS